MHSRKLDRTCLAETFLRSARSSSKIEEGNRFASPDPFFRGSAEAEHADARPDPSQAHANAAKCGPAMFGVSVATVNGHQKNDALRRNQRSDRKWWDLTTPVPVVTRCRRGLVQTFPTAGTRTRTDCRQRGRSGPNQPKPDVCASARRLRREQSRPATTRPIAQKNGAGASECPLRPI